MSSLPSTLDAVTVHRSGAICRRLAVVSPSPERQLRFGGLPLSLEAGSLRARVRRGSNQVVDVRPQFDVELAEAIDVPAVNRALEEVNAKISRLEIERSRLSTEIDSLQNLVPSTLEPKPGDPPRPAPIEAMLALSDFTEAALSTRLARRRALNEELTELHRQRELNEQRAQEASSASRAERARLSRVAVVTLARVPDAEFEIELEYRVPGARWVPSYSLTMERGLQRGVLHMRASVAQNTGEDWTQVRLALSTAEISRRADMPELKSLRIGRKQDEPKRSGWREPPPGLDALFEGYDAAIGPVFGGAPGSGGVSPRGGVEMAKERAPMKPMKKMAAPPPPPPAPAPMMASMAMPPPSAAPMRSRMALGGAAAAPKAAMRRSAVRDEPEADMEDDAFSEVSEMAASFDEGGGGFEEESAAPAADRLGADLGDYARLIMPADLHPGSRGKLAPAPEHSFAFAAGLSVQIDVVINAVTMATSRAQQIDDLPLPGHAQAVHAINSFDYRYDAAARVDVPSTGKWVLTPVMVCEVGLTPEYVAVPSVEAKVYRTLSVANRSTHALLPGPVDVTSGDQFLMTTQLPAIAPGAAQSHRLGLGVEEAIKISRKTHFNETTAGFLGGSTVLPHDIEIEVSNRLPTAAMIEVRERVPWPTGSEPDLKVEEKSATPAWEKIETPIDGEIVRGARRWRITVQPGATQTLTAQFAIRMPSDRMLVGGNRRN